MKIIWYQAYQSEVGGVETVNYNTCKALSEYYDILFLCGGGDKRQLEKMSTVVDVEVYNENKYYEADIVVYSSSWGSRPEEHLIADRYIQLIHADYHKLKNDFGFVYKKTPKTTEHYGGGDNICKAFKSTYKYECGKLPYLLDDVKPEKVLRLITVSRICKGKGFERMLILAKKLKEKNKKFLWDVWGTGTPTDVKKFTNGFDKIPEVCFRGKGDDLASYVKNSDYLVQLSDTEGYCMSMYEALSLNVPVIATDFPNAREQVTDGKNGYIVPMDMDIDVEMLYNIPKFVFEPIGSVDDWIKVLGEPGKKMKRRKSQQSLVRCVKRYWDIDKNKMIKVGDVFVVAPYRAKELVAGGVVELI